MEILGPVPTRRDTARSPLSPQRARVLEELQGSGATTTVEELAARLALHTNTARKHLDGLVERGLVIREQVPAAGRGRPAWSYAAASDSREPDHRVRDYAGLAVALAGHISRTSTDPRADALAAGESWGRSLTRGMTARGVPQARRRVLLILTDLGFAPDPDSRGATARLRRCPLLDAARAQPDVVCPVHLGVVRGALAELGGEPDRAELVPFSEPGACRLDLLAPRPGSAR